MSHQIIFITGIVVGFFYNYTLDRIIKEIEERNKKSCCSCKVLKSTQDQQTQTEDLQESESESESETETESAVEVVEEIKPKIAKEEGIWESWFNVFTTN